VADGFFRIKNKNVPFFSSGACLDFSWGGKDKPKARLSQQHTMKGSRSPAAFLRPVTSDKRPVTGGVNFFTPPFLLYPDFTL
jgi:hypothetical protein